MTVSFTISNVFAAEIDDVFDASLDIDAHLASMESSGEEAIGGVTSGLIGLGESVTWRAKHFGLTWTMTSRITQLDRPRCFVDEQLRGPFKRFRHVHRFESVASGTRMIDEVEFAAPLGVLGTLAEKAVLHRYLPKLIAERNDYLRQRLEGSGPA